MVDHIKLNELRCFNAVVSLGGFQPAASALNKSYPAVFAAVGSLEKQLGLQLLDRRGYRVVPTQAGSDFYQRSNLLLRDAENLTLFAEQLSRGEETQLRVVIGDLVPRGPILESLGTFFANRPRTRLHLDYEAVSGPHERLREAEADLVFHRLVPQDQSLEQVGASIVTLLPVVAPGFLPFPVTDSIGAKEMAEFTQCVIRDTARNDRQDFFVVEGGHQCSVADHGMKRDLIRHQLAWGFLPTWLINDDLEKGSLLSLAGRYLRPFSETIGILRSGARPHGPVAEALWETLRAGYCADGP